HAQLEPITRDHLQVRPCTVSYRHTLSTGAVLAAVGTRNGVHQNVVALRRWFVGDLVFRVRLFRAAKVVCSPVGSKLPRLGAACSGKVNSPRAENRVSWRRWTCAHRLHRSIEGRRRRRKPEGEYAPCELLSLCQRFNGRRWKQSSFADVVELGI